MNTGMLWFDDNPKTELKIKIQRALDYYHTKYGYQADICLVNQSMIGNDQLILGKDGGLEIRAAPYILPHHFWVGVKDK
jgi:hypothetical protein